MRASVLGWIVALSLAALCFLSGLALVFLQPGPWTKNLTDLGAAIGGAWALSAGLLAYSASIWGVSRQEADRIHEVATVCLIEIEAIWAKFDELRVIENLRASSQNLREENVNGVCYRGSIGDAWLSLQSRTPEAFGVLPHDVARRATTHYSRIRVIIGRINWMNSATFGPERYPEVLGRQNSTETELRALQAEKETLLSLLRRNTAKLGRST